MAYNEPPVAFDQSFGIGTTNLGITFAAGLFSITSQDGSPLSGSNIGFVTLPSKSNPGQNLTIPVTADQTFEDSTGSSTIIGNLFGLNTGVAYTLDIPFWVMAVLNDAENAISFMLTRIPHRHTAPAAAKIGKTGSVVANTAGSFFALGNPTVADYEGNPCLNIGGFRMKMNSSDDWAVSSLDAQDGIGQFHIGRPFRIEEGHFGADTGSFFKPNGGTIPVLSGISVINYFFMDLSGLYTIIYHFGTVASDGIGTDTLQIATPFNVFESMGIGYQRGGSTIVLNVNVPSMANNNSILINEVASNFISNEDVVIGTSLFGQIVCIINSED